MRVSDWYWLGEDQSDVSVKVRSLAPAVRAEIDRQWIRFDKPEYGVAPGQAAVAYDGSRVLGGGWIAETVPVEPGAVDQKLNAAAA
jgi:tRNA-specific 2-thiouridylase